MRSIYPFMILEAVGKLFRVGSCQCPAMIDKLGTTPA